MAFFAGPNHTMPSLEVVLPSRSGMAQLRWRNPLSQAEGLLGFWWFQCDFRGDGRFSFPKKLSGSGMLEFPGGDHSWKGPALLFPCGSGKTQQRRGPGPIRAPGRCRWSRNPPWVSTCFNHPLGWSWDPRLKMDGAPHSQVGLCAAHYI